MLRTKLAELRPGDPEGRTNAEALAVNLIELGCSQSRNAVAAIGEILDRTEGKPHQSLAIADVTAELHSKSDADLEFYLQNGVWPEPDRNEAGAAGSEVDEHRPGTVTRR